jgi:hypothetical protein
MPQALRRTHSGPGGVGCSVVEERNGIVNDSRGRIEEIMTRTGLTEAEARARYHLKEAFEALIEVTEAPVVPGAEPIGQEYARYYIGPHVDTLINFLARRVLERERPDGWGRPKGATQE